MRVPAAPEAPKHAEASEDVAVPAPVPETQLQSEGPWPVAVSVNAVSASEPVAEVAAIEDTTVQDAPLAEVAEESVAQPAAAPEPVAQDGVPVTEVPVIQPSPKKPASNARRLNQDAPVVMPSGNATVERIGVQFGSLSIGGVEVGSLAGAGAERPAGEAAPEPAVESVAVQHKAPAVAAPKAEAAPVAAVPMPVHAQQAAVESAAAAQAPLTAYLQQQQQQQQLHQQHHVPVQAHPNASGISQMPLPNDYGTAALYGVDAQRNPMGFYDNYAYGQYAAGKDGAGPNAGAADPRTPATSGQQAAGVSAGANHLGQAGLFPQQVPQPFGMPYYNHPYYYNMVQPGGQYHNPAYGNNPALAAAYAQPFMKQGMYPMYPGATPQGMQAVGAQHAPQQQAQHITQQQAQQQQAQQQQQQQQQQHSPAQQQQAQQQGGAKGPGASAQSSAAQYANISAQKNANAYGHYAANIGSGFGVYEQDPAALSNSPQQYGFGGLPEFLAGAKNGGKDASGKGAHPAGTAPVIGGTTYYSTPQQPGGYPTQASSAHPQAFSHQQQAYYSPYAHNYGQTQMPHGYQQQQQAQAQAQQHPPQAGHPQANKHYWNKQ
ncbi:RNAPII degradation factor [Coemansia spiralis]|nr:RNAPII degradation factor [Coemansia spiralis]